MADFLVRDIDERVAERLKELARQKGWPLNDVILHLLKTELGRPRRRFSGPAGARQALAVRPRR